MFLPCFSASLSWALLPPEGLLTTRTLSEEQGKAFRLLHSKRSTSLDSLNPRFFNSNNTHLFLVPVSKSFNTFISALMTILLSWLQKCLPYSHRHSYADEKKADKCNKHTAGPLAATHTALPLYQIHRYLPCLLCWCCTRRHHHCGTDVSVRLINMKISHASFWLKVVVSEWSSCSLSLPSSFVSLLSFRLPCCFFDHRLWATMHPTTKPDAKMPKPMHAKTTMRVTFTVSFNEFKPCTTSRE